MIEMKQNKMNPNPSAFGHPVLLAAAFGKACFHPAYVLGIFIKY